MSKRKYTEDQLIKAIKSSTSIRQVLSKIGLREAGSNYKHTQLFIAKLKIDTSHFTGKGHLKGKTHNWARSIPLKDILVADSLYTNLAKLKMKLFKANLLEDKCKHCGIAA